MSFSYLVERTEGLGDYRALKEAVLLQLSRATARFEVAVTSTSLHKVLGCDVELLARRVVGNSLLIQASLGDRCVRLSRLFFQIPRCQVPEYALALLRELVTPLQAALAGSLDGPGQLSTLRQIF